jgi:hypothetical protein
VSFSVPPCPCSAALLHYSFAGDPRRDFPFSSPRPTISVRDRDSLTQYLTGLFCASVSLCVTRGHYSAFFIRLSQEWNQLVFAKHWQYCLERAH